MVATSYGHDAHFYVVCWQVAAIAFLLSSFSLVAFGNTLKGVVSYQIRKHSSYLGLPLLYL